MLYNYIYNICSFGVGYHPVCPMIPSAPFFEREMFAVAEVFTATIQPGNEVFTTGISWEIYPLVN